MKDNIPIVYWVFRGVWSSLHLIIALAVIAAAALWSLHDDNAVHWFKTGQTELVNLQYAVSSAIPFPWGA